MHVCVFVSTMCVCVCVPTQATASAVRRGQEDESVRCFQLVGDVCEAPAPLVGPHLASVVRLVCETASATQVSPEVRDQALEVLTVLAE